jgi:hypothetical protein
MQLFTTPSLGEDFADSSSDGDGQVVASYPTYRGAQQAVDRSADASFPVHYTKALEADDLLRALYVERTARTRSESSPARPQRARSA